MYSQFAKVYDLLMNDVGYGERADYICTLFERYDRMPTLLLDLACGTGEFSNKFADRGVSVIGVDMSPEMLSVAMEKTKEQGNDVLYLCQNAAELDLYGTVDGAVCCLDSINHITDYKDVCDAFKKVSLFLEEDRLFVFDVNSVYKHKTVLADNTFVIEEDGIYCVWVNCFDEDTNITSINLDFFTEEEDGRYIRSSEYIEERAYTKEEIVTALIGAGFKVEACFDDMTEELPKAETERIVYVARKVKVNE